jgi:hypothetical protein
MISPARTPVVAMADGSAEADGMAVADAGAVAVTAADAVASGDGTATEWRGEKGLSVALEAEDAAAATTPAEA